VRPRNWRTGTAGAALDRARGGDGTRGGWAPRRPREGADVERRRRARGEGGPKPPRLQPAGEDRRAIRRHLRRPIASTGDERPGTAGAAADRARGGKGTCGGRAPRCPEKEQTQSAVDTLAGKVDLNLRDCNQFRVRRGVRLCR
jgi:hypothetical protein